MGSMNAAQNEQVAKPTRLTDGLDTRPEPKKVSQCIATMNPVRINFQKSFCEGKAKEPLMKKIRAPIPIVASNVR